nr:transposase [Cohnella sp. WQ 127256]
MVPKRWAIETFFKWMKQHVRIKSIYGTSKQAVTNQVWMALIVFCLLVLVKMETGPERSLLELYRWLKTLLRESADEWLLRIRRKPARASARRRKKRKVY